MADDDKDAAEDYRHQRQAAVARKIGLAPKTLQEQLQWMEDNKDLVLSVARGGFGDAEAIVEEYKQALLNTSPGSALDDTSARQILERVLKEIEDACRQNQIPVRSGVVFGVTPGFGLHISQFSVLGTQASIIEVTIPFLVFCNLITKALALTLPQSPAGSSSVSVSNDPALVITRLQQSPHIVTEWTRILGAYAELGWPPLGIHLVADAATQAVRVMLIRAVEIFVLAHEYGHHVMRHGVTDSSAQVANSFVEERQADIFARSACLAIGSRDAPPNFYAMTGTGGVIILGALDLVRRTKAVLKTGQDHVDRSASQPPLRDRIATIALLDQQLPLQQRRAAAEMRGCFIEIMEVIWAAVRWNIVKLHEEGVRPVQGAPDPGGWLPP